MSKKNRKKFQQQALKNKKGMIGSPQKQATGGPGIFSNFESAKFSNKRSWIWSSWPTDFKKTMTVFDRLETTRKMRWLELNSGLIRQVISDIALYSVGDGIKHRAHTNDPAWNEMADDYFCKWSRRGCEITGRFTFLEVQNIATRLMIRDGEIFTLKTRNQMGSAIIQLIEAHQVATENSGSPPSGMVDGIQFDAYGRVAGYNVVKSDGSSRMLPGQSMMHVFAPEVATGARAYSPLQHSINNIVDMLEILSLEKMAVKADGDATRVIYTERGQFDSGDNEAFGMTPATVAGATDTDQASTFIGGKVLALKPGEKMESMASNRPSPTFTGFIEHLQRDSMQGTLPFEFSIDPTKAGGATMRFVLSKADRYCSYVQNILINRLLTPTWGYVISNAIRDGELPDNKEWNRVEWTTPRRVTVDAGRESAQNRADIEVGLKTRTENYQEQGQDFLVQTRLRAAEMRATIDIAKEYNVPFETLWRPTQSQTGSLDMLVNGENPLEPNQPTKPEDK
jgi:lambda family phage portal protein